MSKQLTKQVNFRLSEELYDRAKAKAESESLTLSTYVTTLVERDLFYWETGVKTEAEQLALVFGALKQLDDRFEALEDRLGQR